LSLFEHIFLFAPYSCSRRTNESPNYKAQNQEGYLKQVASGVELSNTKAIPMAGIMRKADWIVLDS